ncbi:MAG: VOC family protein [Thermomicrobiales bacterium]
MAITGIQFAFVYVSDLERAIAWYRDALGMPVRIDNPMPGGVGRWVEVAAPGSEAALVLLYGHSGWTPEKVGVETGIGLRARDADATLLAFTERGVEFVHPIVKESWGWFALIKDLDGNTFVIGGDE